MEIFILEDMNELEAAKIMLGGLLERGEIRGPARARFLMLRRLEELEERLSVEIVSFRLTVCRSSRHFRIYTALFSMGYQQIRVARRLHSVGHRGHAPGD